MGKYLTVNQYKRYGDGISLASVSDQTLAMTIARSEAAIDSHMGFDPLHGGFEPHFDRVQQTYDEHTRKSWFTNWMVPVRNIQRYRIQVSNVGSSGQGFFATISPNDCVINLDSKYIEIVPLQALTYALSPVLLQLGLKPPIIEMDVEVGFYLPVIGEQLISDGRGYTYSATDGFWASTYTLATHVQPLNVPPIPPNVYVNGVLQSASAYTVNYLEGSVTFTAMQSPTATITCDYTKTIPDQVVEAAVLQTSSLLAQRALNTVGMYKGLFHIRTGEQEINFPRTAAVSDQGRSTASSLCSDAAAVLSNLEGIAIA